MKIITTEKINKILEKSNQGFKLTLKEKIFWQGQIGIALNNNTKVDLTYEELVEYGKCANDIIYFIETYCKIKLRKYQIEWVEGFINNRFMIYDTSRQTGYSQIMSAIFIHYICFNINKNILTIANKNDDSIEIINKIWKYYINIPFFLRPGIIAKNIKNISFSNGNKINTKVRIKNEKDDTPIDVLSFYDFAQIPQYISNDMYKNLIPKTSGNNSRIIIQSQPNGTDNLFYKLVNNSERKDGDPLKNIYKTIKTYWWEVEGRDDAWKQHEIRDLGSEEYFNQEYDLQFVTKNIMK